MCQRAIHFGEHRNEWATKATNVPMRAGVQHLPRDCGATLRTKPATSSVRRRRCECTHTHIHTHTHQRTNMTSGPARCSQRLRAEEFLVQADVSPPHASLKLRTHSSEQNFTFSVIVSSPNVTWIDALATWLTSRSSLFVQACFSGHCWRLPRDIALGYLLAGWFALLFCCPVWYFV